MSAENIADLRKWFVENAQVLNREQGYILVPPLNITLSTALLRKITAGWAHCLEGQQFDAVVGLPDAGARLVSALAMIMDIPVILPAKKRACPTSWSKVGQVVRYEAKTFTGPGQEIIQAFIGGIVAGMRILVIDDVSATGEVGVAAIAALQAAGTQVGAMGVIFDKSWQNGVARIERETGVPVFSLITVDSIDENNRVVLRAAQPNHQATV
jgi:adenine/guanine phosphoribosyltransferase-like PRPP-binding protein